MITAPGVNEFIDLGDAPHSYAGQASKVVKVNTGETAVEFGTGGGAGSTTFIGLTDVPASYVGSEGKVVAVNGTATALEFITAPSGGGTVKGQADITFGVMTQEDSIAVATVSTASALTTSVITVSPSGVATADHDPDDYQWDNISGYVSNIINGVSFDIIGVAPNGSWGSYKFNYTIN